MAQWTIVPCRNLSAISRGDKELWSIGQTLTTQAPPRNSPNCAQTETSGRLWGIICLQCLQEDARSWSEPSGSMFYSFTGCYKQIITPDFWENVISWLMETSKKHCLVGTNKTCWFPFSHSLPNSLDFTLWKNRNIFLMTLLCSVASDFHPWHLLAVLL